ncbi:MAG: recombinase family protein [Sedimentisphaerales bacterium]|nr:recombinase family protein [Sedimentisphaerales bacterium]
MRAKTNEELREEIQKARKRDKIYAAKIGMRKLKKVTAIYVRVSTNSQSTRSQKPDILRWIKAQEDELNIKWFIDKASGKSMDRPRWNKLQAAIDNNRVGRLVVWRLDRLGRTASGLTKLFEELQARKIQFESIKDKIDLNTTAGRLIANVLASVAAYEVEVKSERVRAGQAIAKAAGKRWGGSKKGSLYKITDEQVKQIVKMKKAGKKITTIARTVGVNRQSIYRVLKRVEEGDIKAA